MRGEQPLLRALCVNIERPVHIRRNAQSALVTNAYIELCAEIAFCGALVQNAHAVLRLALFQSDNAQSQRRVVVAARNGFDVIIARLFVILFFVQSAFVIISEVEQRGRVILFRRPFHGAQRLFVLVRAVVD